MQKFRSFLVLFILSAIATFWGIGVSYSRQTASITRGNSINIGADGWVENGATFELPVLLNRFNYAKLKFNDWRPQIPDSNIKVQLCDQAPIEFLIGKGTRIHIPLESICQPKKLNIEVLNPQSINPSDPRQLGPQLIDVQVSSKLGVPILDWKLTLVVTLCISLLSILVWLVLKTIGLQAFSLIIPFFCYYPLTRVDLMRLEMPFWAWFSLSLIALGALWQNRLQNSDKLSQDLNPIFVLVLLPLITLIASALRFHGIDFGLPNNYHPDEVPKVNAIMTMVGTHSLNPRYFLHPSLLLYCTYGLNSILHFAGIGGEFRETAFLAGRSVSAIAGSLSVPLVYAIGRRLSSQFVGLLAASLLAVIPLHITCSRYLKEDALLTFLILSCVLLLLKALQEQRNIFLYLAGICAGLTASTKYSGIVSGLLIFIFPWMSGSGLKPNFQKIKPTLIALTLIPIAFLCASPFVLLDFEKFSSDFRYERNHMLRGHTEAIDAWSQFWAYHIGNSLVPGTSLIPYILGFLGFGLFLWRRKREDLYILAVFLLFFLPAEWVKSKPAPQPERYILPCLPFLGLAAAALVQCILRSKYKALGVLLALMLVLVPAWRSVNLSADITPDTREQMTHWILRNVPPGSRILLDWQPYGPYLPPRVYDVEFIMRENINSKLIPKALKDSQFDYLVLSSLFFERYFSQPRSDSRTRNRFSTIFTSVPIVEQITAPSGTNGFHNPTLTLFTLNSEAFQALDSQLELKASGQLAMTSNEMRASLLWKQNEISLRQKLGFGP